MTTAFQHALPGCFVCSEVLSYRYVCSSFGQVMRMTNTGRGLPAKWQWPAVAVDQQDLEGPFTWAQVIQECLAQSQLRFPFSKGGCLLSPCLILVPESYLLVADQFGDSFWDVRAVVTDDNTILKSALPSFLQNQTLQQRSDRFARLQFQWNTEVSDGTWLPDPPMYSSA